MATKKKQLTGSFARCVDLGNGKVTRPKDAPAGSGAPQWAIKIEDDGDVKTGDMVKVLRYADKEIFQVRLGALIGVNKFNEPFYEDGGKFDMNGEPLSDEPPEPSNTRSGTSA